MKRTKFLWNNVYDLNTERGVMFIRFPCDDKVKLHHAVLTKKRIWIVKFSTLITL